jgi:site-specific recombinase XerD
VYARTLLGHYSALGAAGNRLAFHSVAEIIENENSYESSLERNSSPEIYVPKTQNNDAEGATRYEGYKGRFGWHNLRHSLATFFAANEVNLPVIQSMLRHAKR